MNGASGPVPEPARRLRVAYVHDEEMPTNDTACEQAVNTSAALSPLCDVTLFLPRQIGAPNPSAESIRDYYQVGGDFSVETFATASAAPRWWQKAAHSLCALTSSRLSGFDVVHTRNISTMVTLALRGVPMTYETYRPWATEHKALAPMFRRVARRDNFLGMVVHSQYCKDCYVELGIDPDLIEVVYNGYQPERMEPRLSRAEAREAIGMAGESRPVAMYVGRVSMGKGCGVLLEMAERMPDVVFAIVGSEGRSEVEQRAEALANVRVFGWQRYESIPPFLYASDALVIPPTLGPLASVGNTVLPMKLFFYLASGRPIFAPVAPDTAELLRDSDTARLVPADDLDAAVAALGALLSDRSAADRIANAALATAADLTWDARAAKVAAMWRRALG